VCDIYACVCVSKGGGQIYLNPSEYECGITGLDMGKRVHGRVNPRRVTEGSGVYKKGKFPYRKKG
jgi:hypothetical protein